MDYRAVIGESIVVLRRRAGWKAKELAARARMDKAQLSGYELAKKWVSLPVLLRITEALDLSLAEFFRFAEEQGRSRQSGGDSPEGYPPSSFRSRRRLQEVAQRKDRKEYAEPANDDPGRDA